MEGKWTVPPGTPRMYVSNVHSSGMEIRKDGSVWLMSDGEWRKATRKEAIQRRAGVRFAFGESIADLAGIEPE